MRTIELIDAQGNREFIRQQGRLGVTRHVKVLSALEKRSLRFRRKGRHQVDLDEVLFNEAIDETGTVSTVELTDSDSEGGYITEAEATFLEERRQLGGAAKTC